MGLSASGTRDQFDAVSPAALHGPVLTCYHSKAAVSQLGRGGTSLPGPFEFVCCNPGGRGLDLLAGTQAQP